MDYTFILLGFVVLFGFVFPSAPLRLWLSAMSSLSFSGFLSFLFGLFPFLLAMGALAAFRWSPPHVQPRVVRVSFLLSSLPPPVCVGSRVQFRWAFGA